MKIHLACFALLAAAACTPAADKPAEPAAVAPAAGEPIGPPPATASVLAGKWTGTIACYQMDSNLQVAIDGATPDKAAVSMGGASMVSWEAKVTYDETRRWVVLAGGNAMADAAVIEGTLAGDNNSITGAMEKQLCRTFKLTRTP